MVKYIAVVTLFLASAGAVAEQSPEVRQELRLICNSQPSLDDKSEQYQSAKKMYSYMKEYEKQACSKRGDDYLSFLTKKYSQLIKHYSSKNPD